MQQLNVDFHSPSIEELPLTNSILQDSSTLIEKMLVTNLKISF